MLKKTFVAIAAAALTSGAAVAETAAERTTQVSPDISVTQISPEMIKIVSQDQTNFYSCNEIAKINEAFQPLAFLTAVELSEDPIGNIVALKDNDNAVNALEQAAKYCKLDM